MWVAPRRRQFLRARVPSTALAPCPAPHLLPAGALDGLNGSAGSNGTLMGVLKTATPQASLFVVPAGMTYVRDGGSSDSGLSAGAIAGIAAGGAAGATLLAAALWLLLVRRQRHLPPRQADKEGCPCCGSGSGASSGASEGKCSGESKAPISASSAADPPSAGSAADPPSTCSAASACCTPAAS